MGANLVNFKQTDNLFNKKIELLFCNIRKKNPISLFINH
jgi:hypothetical protein